MAADMWCIAITTPFTLDVVHALGTLDPRWIVDDAPHVAGVAHLMITKQAEH